MSSIASPKNVPEPTEVRPTTKPHDRADRDRDQLLARVEMERRVVRATAHERLDREADAAGDQCAADDAAHRRLRGVGERARDLDADQRERRRADEHPERERHVDVAELPVAHGAERLEDRAVQDVGADRGLRVEAEEQDQHRRHQAAAAHAGHADEDADQRGRRSTSSQVTCGRPGSGRRRTAGRAAGRRACTPRSPCRSRSARRAARARRRAARARRRPSPSPAA